MFFAGGAMAESLLEKALSIWTPTFINDVYIYYGDYQHFLRY